MAQQIQLPNAHTGMDQSRERSLYTSSTAGETAYEAGEQPSPTLPNYSSCSACNKIEYGVEELRQNPEKPLHGWPALAKEMSKNPDFEAFPTFRDLNIKSLLYYQAELTDLRYQLQFREWDDHTSNGFDGAATLNRDVLSLLECKGMGKKNQKQIDLITDIRRVLKEYNAALLQYSQINALPEAEDLNVDSLRIWLGNKGMGNAEVRGQGSKTWGDWANEDDETSLGEQFGKLVKSVFWPAKVVEKEYKLVVPQKAKEVDGLTRWIAQEWVPFWQKLRENPPWNRPPGEKHEKQDESQLPIGRPHKAKSSGSVFSRVKRWRLNSPWARSHRNPKDQADQASKDEENPKTLNHYAMSTMLKFTSLVATVIACLLPIVSITVLAKMHTQAEILGYMTLFTALFALGLMWLTNPGTSRTEIFTATAAFSAVLVVFVQNQNGNSNGS